MRSIIIILALFCSAFSWHGRFDTLWIDHGLKLRNAGNLKRLCYVNPIDSLVDTTGISYDTIDKITYFPYKITFDSSTLSSGITKIDPARYLYMSVGGDCFPDSGAYLMLEGFYDQDTSGDYELHAAYNGDGWYKASFHYFTFGGDTSEMKLIPIPGTGVGMGCSQPGDTLNVFGGNGEGSGVRLFNTTTETMGPLKVDTLPVRTTLPDSIVIARGDGLLQRITADNFKSGLGIHRRTDTLVIMFGTDSLCFKAITP